MNYNTVEQAAKDEGLIVMGALSNEGTLILLGTGRKFWPVFSVSPERVDNQADPIDRWSLRIVGGLAQRLQAHAVYPFGGPPYEPFIRWAQVSGRAFQSPVGMLVHDAVGMMVSYRGALQFSETFDTPPAVNQSPCQSCVDQPCTTACPVDALSADHGYNIDTCHNFLDTRAGQDCMINGCAARRACPVSQLAQRDPVQSNLHMKAFTTHDPNPDPNAAR